MTGAWDGGTWGTFNYNPIMTCGTCKTKVNITQLKSDFLFFNCKNCQRLTCIPPKDWRFNDPYMHVNKIKLNKEDIDELIDIALLIKDKNWFHELLWLQNGIEGEWYINTFREVTDRDERI